MEDRTELVVVGLAWVAERIDVGVAGEVRVVFTAVAKGVAECDGD